MIIIVAVQSSNFLYCNHLYQFNNNTFPSQEHYINSHHNPAYDHEAFLGEEAKTFDQLSPEESTRRLGIIVDRIDKDSDGFVTQEELKDWVKYTQQRYIRDDVERHWRSHVPDDKDKLSWKEYMKTVYGFMDEEDNEQRSKEDEQAGKDDDDKISYAAMRKRDRRRWSAADHDGDDSLTKEEFASFMHPEESEHMRDIVVQEAMEDIDKDGDGKISLSEYIGNLGPLQCNETSHSVCLWSSINFMEITKRSILLISRKNQALINEDFMSHWV